MHSHEISFNKILIAQTTAGSHQEALLDRPESLGKHLERSIVAAES